MRQNHNKSNIGIIFLHYVLMSVFLSSCSVNETKYESRFYNFDNYGLTPGFEYIFNDFNGIKYIPKEDFIRSNLLIRFNDKCKIKNLPLTLEYSSYDSDSICQRDIIIPLFNEEGKTLGKGNFGLYETIVPLNLNLKNLDGFYLSATTHEKETSGVLAIGLILK